MLFRSGIQATYSGAGGGGYAITTPGGAGIQFYTFTGVVGSETYTERMRIDSSGFVGIGDNSPSSTSPLTVKTAPTNANVGQICARSQSAGDVANAGMSVIKVDNNTTTSQIFFKFLINNAAAGSGQINANGASAAAFGSYSDARLKENIEPLPSQRSEEHTSELQSH